MNKDVAQQVAVEMLRSAQLPDTQTRNLFEKAIDPDYWRHLNRELSLEETVSGDFDRSDLLGTPTITDLAERFATDGYFQTEVILPLSALERMRTTVELLRRENWPPIFAFVYDEFWAIARSGPLRQLATAFLGSGYRQNSVVWTYYVDVQSGSAGWPPHVDGNGEKRLTMWIPLTDATLENGCICVIPRSRVPDSLPDDYGNWDVINRSELARMLQASRPMPARTGSVIGWDHSVIHWSSISRGAPTPRVNIGVEFIGADATAADWEDPLLKEDSLPVFPQRLYIIGKRLLEYKKFEPFMTKYSDLAKQLMVRYATHPLAR